MGCLIALIAVVLCLKGCEVVAPNFIATTNAAEDYLQQQDDEETYEERKQSEKTKNIYGEGIDDERFILESQPPEDQDSDEPETSHNDSNESELHSYAGDCEVGVDIPAGIYKVFGKQEAWGSYGHGWYVINKRAKGLQGWSHGDESFTGCRYAEFVDGTYVHFVDGTTAVPLEEVPVCLRTNIGPVGWFRVGTDCAAGTYSPQAGNDWPRGRYEVYTSVKYPYELSEIGTCVTGWSPGEIVLNDGDYVHLNGVVLSLV